MTRVDFHYNAPDKVGYACRLVRKIHRAGQRVVVAFGGSDAAQAEARLARFDEALWTFSPLDFIPHVRAGDALADRTPVVLTAGGHPVPHHDVLLNLGDGMPESFASFERLIEVVAADAGDRELARERFRFYKDRGYPLLVHDLASAQATN